jgi:uncharacterized protein (TIGR02594 family)
MASIRARAPAPKTVIYEDQDGTEMVREGGSRAWRNNNPGNIEKGSFADEHDAIGGDSRFAIFPDEATGLRAVVALLKTPAYQKHDLAGAINRYAPPTENNTKGYVAFVVAQTKLKATDKLSDMSDSQLESIAQAIKKIEGWVPGKEYINKSFALLTEGSDLDEPVSSAAVASDDWMKIALAEASLPEHERSEWPDPGENPRILEYFRIAAPWFDAKSEGGDEVDWCAAFVNYCIETAGYQGTSHPGARSFYWNKGDKFLKLDEPVYGSIAVFRDAPFTPPSWPTGTGHVGFVVNWTADTVELLGGNQGRTVRRQTFKRQYKSGSKVTRKVVAFMVPVMN